MRPELDIERQRKALPIWQKQNEIREKLRRKDILLLTGETGSGKSTQVPQYLYTEQWCQQRIVKLKDGQKVKVGGIIAVTEPRRVAAISLARRVATEMRTTCGSQSPASKVGYSVRFDSSISPAMR